MQTTLFLARHGQSELNHSSRVTGQLDPALSPQGIEQSKALAGCFGVQGLDAIYVSALRRTAQTALPSARATGLPLQVEPALNEIDMGELQGRFRDERDPQAQALWARWKVEPWSFTVPGGESFAAFAERVQTALHAILQRHAGQRVLVVAHGGTNRVVLGTLLAWPRARWPEIRQRNKRCYRLQLGAGAPEVDTFTLGGRHSGRCEAGLVV